MLFVTMTMALAVVDVGGGSDIRMVMDNGMAFCYSYETHRMKCLFCFSLRAIHKVCVSVYKYMYIYA